MSTLTNIKKKRKGLVLVATTEEIFLEVVQGVVSVVTVRVVREVTSENPAIAVWRQTHDIQLNQLSSQEGFDDSEIIARARALAADKVPGGRVESIIEWDIDKDGSFVGSRYVYGELE